MPENNAAEDNVSTKIKVGIVPSEIAQKLHVQPRSINHIIARWGGITYGLRKGLKNRMENIFPIIILDYVKEKLKLRVK